MHIHIFISSQSNELAGVKWRRVRTNSALWKCSEMEVYKKTCLETNKYNWRVSITQTFELLVSERDPELFWSASLNRFSSTYFQKNNNHDHNSQKFNCRCYHTKCYTDKGKERNEKAARKLVLLVGQCSNFQAILYKLIRNTEHVLWRGTFGLFTGFVAMKIFRF